MRNAESAMVYWSMEEASRLVANLDKPVHAEAVTDEDGYVKCPNFRDRLEVHKAPPEKQSNRNCNNKIILTKSNISSK